MSKKRKARKQLTAQQRRERRVLRLEDRMHRLEERTRTNDGDIMSIEAQISEIRKTWRELLRRYEQHYQQRAKQLEQLEKLE